LAIIILGDLPIKRNGNEKGKKKLRRGKVKREFKNLSAKEIEHPAKREGHWFESNPDHKASQPGTLLFFIHLL
jgi:hypothetical protein